MKASPEIFKQRAGEEARRYGADPWIFVRELVQNARDAGASRVDFSVGSGAGHEWIRCRDDGGGLDRQKAARFLFTLYASSKGAPGDVGRFGVGFWSILRFAPNRIEVSSVARSGGGFRVVLDGSLQLLEEGAADGPAGTEVTLERPGTGEGLAEALLAAARDQVGLATRKGRRRRPLVVTVAGRPATRELALAAPSSRFSGPGFRGVVGLGDRPRAELYACGLKVREAPSLDDLLAEDRRTRRARPGVLEAGLAPRVLLDGDRLELLLARGDARDDRELERLVGRARRELDRLLQRALDRRVPRSLSSRVRERLTRWAAAVWSRRRLSTAAAAALAVVAVALLGLRTRALDAPRPTAPGRQAARPLGDLAAAYHGPDVGLAAAMGAVVELRYRPPGNDLLLTVLRLDGASLGDARDATGLAPASAPPCTDDCVELEVAVGQGVELVRLPVPSGLTLDPASLRVDGSPADAWTTARGETVLRLQSRHGGLVRYRAGPAPEPEALASPRWPDLPPSLEAEAGRLSGLPEDERVIEATALVRRLVRYDRSLGVMARYRAAAAAGVRPLDRALEVGAGDCDVQNSLLAALLDASGTRSWLAVGLVGHGGRALPGLHAWVELELRNGRRGVADASLAPLRGPEPDEPAVAAGAGSSRDVATGPAVVAARSLASGGAGVALALAVVIVAVAWVSRRTVRRRVELGEPLDLAELVRGALQHPEAFAGLAGVATRPLVPCRGRRRLSLGRARALAREGRLLASAHGGELAERAAETGLPVVDAARPEGAAVASGLAAVDLDWWQDGRKEVERDGPLHRLDQVLASVAAGVRLVAAPGLGPAVRCLDLSRLGFGRDLLVALDPTRSTDAAEVRLDGGPPAAQTLRLLERLLARLEISVTRSDRARRAVALAALREAASR